MKTHLDFANGLWNRLGGLKSVECRSRQIASGPSQANFTFKSTDGGQFKVTVERVG